MQKNTRQIALEVLSSAWSTSTGPRPARSVAGVAGVSGRRGLWDRFGMMFFAIAVIVHDIGSRWGMKQRCVASGVLRWPGAFGREWGCRI